MSPTVERVVTDEALPERADVVVVGAGVMGTAAALFLAERGVSVVLVEKGRVAGEQSSRNWGWCREQLRSLPEIPLAMLSMRLWRGMSERIGADSGFRQTGMMVVTRDEGELDRWQHWMAASAAFGMAGGMLSAREVRRRLPGSAEAWIGAIHSPVDGWAEPATAVPAMAAAARRAGATIVQGCAVRGWETQGGRLSHVVTEQGSVRAAAVLVCGGAWSAMLMRRQGIRFLQSGVLATACRTGPAPEIVAGGVGSPEFSFRRRDDGGYTLGLRGRGRVELSPLGLRDAASFLPLFLRRRKDLSLRLARSFLDGPYAWRSWQLDAASPFEAAKARIYDPAPDPVLVRKGLEAFRAAYPALQGVGVAQSWGGLIDTTPDMVPVIGPVPHAPGVFVASGGSGHGFALGPGAGWLAAQQVLGETPDVDAHPFRFSRFAERAPHRTNVGL